MKISRELSDMLDSNPYHPPVSSQNIKISPCLIAIGTIELLILSLIDQSLVGVTYGICPQLCPRMILAGLVIDIPSVWCRYDMGWALLWLRHGVFYAVPSGPFIMSNLYVPMYYPCYYLIVCLRIPLIILIRPVYTLSYA